MEVTEIRRFDLQGRDEEHLRQRLSTFRHAVGARRGSILDVRWAPQTSRGMCEATVVYELPTPHARTAPAQASAGAQ